MDYIIYLAALSLVVVAIDFISRRLAWRRHRRRYGAADDRMDTKSPFMMS